MLHFDRCVFGTESFEETAGAVAPALIVLVQGSGGQELDVQVRHEQPTGTGAAADVSVAVVVPALMAAFPLARNRVGGLGGVVTCRVVALVEVGDAGRLVDWAAEKCRLTLQIVKRCDDTAGFVVLPRRWVVERTLSWLMRSRRLVRDYETLPAMHEAMVLWSMTMLMSCRLAGRRPGGFSRPAPRAR